MNTEKSFKYWIAQEVEEVFGVKRVSTSPLLERWLERKVDIAKQTLDAAEVLRTELVKSVDYWNEATLKFLFIGPFKKTTSRSSSAAYMLYAFTSQSFLVR